MGLEIVGEFNEINTWYTRFASRIAELRAAKNRGLAEWKGVGRYPDANLTLRMTYGKIGGYSPADAVNYRYYTTAAGALAKHTNADPFDVPDDMIAKVKAKDFGRYADKATGSMFTCFLSDTDITGGNSGSPIMNGRGEMIGIAFDGNYEAMTSDFRFEPELTRTINVDIRYVLWCTEKLAGMKRLVDEMKIVD
jgi:V8-like Glu-specific endopeptidase